MKPIKTAKVILAGVCAAMAAPAQAESLWLEAIYPAQWDLPSDVEVLASEEFGGDVGPDLQLELIDRLSNVRIGRDAWFRFSDAGTVFDEGDALSPDAVFRGSVRSEVIDRRTEPRIEEECVKRDDKKKCIKTREIRIPCRELTVEVAPRISLVARNGDVLYQMRGPAGATQRYCNDERAPSSIGMIDGLVEEIVLAMRSDLAPSNTRTAVRIMERRKGLKGDDRNAFKDAVKLTDNDPYGSCEAFKALEANNPDHSSVLFNIGLCYEVEGDLDTAGNYYDRVLVVDPGRDYAEQGLSRIRWQRRALAQLEARGF